MKFDRIIREMTARNPIAKPAMGALIALALAPAGCGLVDMDRFGAQPSYHPLNAEFAVQAAPEAPAGAEGARLYCRIGNGSAHFASGWAEYAPGDVMLSPGTRANVSLPRSSGSEQVTLQGIFDANGQKLIFCPLVGGPPDKRVACASLYALEDDLAAGVKRTFEVPDAVRGADITCAYKAEKLQKL
jgi:hypothetical protein